MIVKNLVVDMLLGTAFITKNIQSIYTKQGVTILTGKGSVALEQLSKGEYVALQKEVDF